MWNPDRRAGATGASGLLLQELLQQASQRHQDRGALGRKGSGACCPCLPGLQPALRGAAPRPSVLLSLLPESRLWPAAIWRLNPSLPIVRQTRSARRRAALVLNVVCRKSAGESQEDGSGSEGQAGF